MILKPQRNSFPFAVPENAESGTSFAKYSVNVLVDNGDRQGTL
jgi:hypothetical protein